MIKGVVYAFVMEMTSNPRRLSRRVPPGSVGLIKNAKKINAVSLGHQFRKQGLATIPTAPLVDAGVKVTGTKEGATYSCAG